MIQYWIEPGMFEIINLPRLKVINFVRSIEILINFSDRKPCVNLYIFNVELFYNPIFWKKVNSQLLI